MSNIIYLHHDPVQQAMNIAIAINAALDGITTQTSLNGVVTATSEGNVVTVTSAEGATDITLTRNNIVFYSSASSMILSPDDGSLGGGSAYVPENNGTVIPQGSVFKVQGDNRTYIVTQNCIDTMYFQPPAETEWAAQTLVDFHITIAESAHTLFTVTEDCAGTELKFSPALDTIWFRGTLFSFAAQYELYDDSGNGQLYFLPSATSDWPIGTELTFGVPVDSTLPVACDRRFSTCISYGNEKRYCGFPTTGGKSITV